MRTATVSGGARSSRVECKHAARDAGGVFALLTTVLVVLSALASRSVPTGSVLAAQQRVGMGAELALEVVAQVGGSARSVAVKGNHAYVGQGPRLGVVDVAVKTNPRFVGQSALFPDLVEAVEAAPSSALIYAAAGASGLRVLDVSTPTLPVERGVCGLSGRAVALALNGGYAFVAVGEEGLSVVDVGDPAFPREIGRYQTPSAAVGVAVRDGYAYVACHSAGLLILDVRNPSSPQFRGQVATPGYCRAVDVSGTNAFVAAEARWDPGAGQYVGGGLQLVDVADKANPTIVGFLPTSGAADQLGAARRVRAVGAYAYVADATGGLRVIRVDSASGPDYSLIEIGFFHPAGLTAVDLDSSGSFVFLADQSSGLRVIDVSQPRSPNARGRYTQALCTADGLEVAGQWAYVAAGEGGLVLGNLSNPTQPILASPLPLPGWSSDIELHAGRAYVSAAYGGLQIVDVNDPTRPRLAGSWSPEGTVVLGMDVQAELGYIAADSEGLFLLSLASPSAPRVLGACELANGQARSVAVRAGLAYVAAGSEGVQVIGVSDPSSPVRLGTGLPLPDAWGIVISGTCGYVAGGGAGVHCLDLSIPLGPTEAWRFASGYARSLAVFGNYVYSADQFGVHALNVSDPKAPYLAGSCALPVQALDVAVSWPYAYVAAGEAGMYVLRARLLPPTPTPTITPLPSATVTRTATATRTTTATPSTTRTPFRTRVFMPVLRRS